MTEVLDKSIKLKILHLGKRTDGDPYFYERWEELGSVTRYEITSHDFDCLVVDYGTNVDDELMKKFPKLKYVCTATTGHTHIKIDPKRYGIKVISLQGERNFLNNITSVSEYVIGMIFRVYRPTDGIGIKLWNKTLGIVGLGRIGSHLHDRMWPMVNKIHCVDIDSTPNDWNRLFLDSDIISLHINESDKNKWVINKYYLDKMKSTAIFINTSRSSVLDEDYLYSLLKKKKILGAVLDVCETPERFMALDNVIVTPHIAGSTLEDRMLTDQFIVEKLKMNLTEKSQQPDIIQ